jgi:L-aminopeptidase/D-esterase-like protein
MTSLGTCCGAVRLPSRDAAAGALIAGAVALLAAGPAAGQASGPAGGQASAPPTPRVITSADAGGRVLHFDFPAMRVGVAEYDEGPTGTTAFYFPKGAMAAADVRGGAPGTVNVPAARLGYEDRWLSAVVLSGGSWYGLSAATGAANQIKDLRLAKEDYDYIAGVMGAIIFDVGRRRFSRVTPDDRLGRAALRSAKPGWFPLGAHGGGRFAMQGYYFAEPDSLEGMYSWPHSGEGGAFRTIGPTKIGVFTVVNALGTIVDREGRVVRCRRNETGSPCPTIAEMLARRSRALGTPGQGTAADSSAGGFTDNTTITLVVTNQKLPFWELQRLAVQVHTSMARTIQPFSTAEDGDALYAVTTGEVENPELSSVELGVAAAELAWDAVLSTVPELPALPKPLTSAPAPSELRSLAGTYTFPGGGQLTVTVGDLGLVGSFTGEGRMYFRDGRSYRLLPAEGGLFLVEGPAHDVIRFERSGGEVSGLTLNPGPWGITVPRSR